MSEQIEPALSAEEWRTGDLPQYPSLLGDITYVDEPASIAAIIAVANRQLPDSDPRKITREWVESLRKEAERGRLAERVGDNAGYSSIDPDLADQMADALESYLPPEA